jgi:O-antigen/teichoic acid export membrane protein
MTWGAAARPAWLRGELGRTAVLVGGTGVASALSLLYLVLASRALGPQRAADFYAGLFLVFVALTLASPLTNALTQLSAGAHGRGERGRIAALRRVALRRLVAAGAAVVVLLAFAWRPLVALGRFEAPATLAVACAAAWLAALVGVDRAILRGQQRFAGYCAHLVFEAALRLAIGWLVLAFAAGAAAALVPIALAALAGTGLGSALVRGSASPGAPARPEDRVQFERLALSMLALSVADAGYQNADVFVAKALFDPAAAAAYGAAAALARGFGVLITPLVIFALPVLTAEHVRGRRTGEVMGRAIGTGIALCALPLAAIALHPEAIASHVLGSAFAAAAPLLLALSLSTLFGFFSILLLQDFLVMRRRGVLALYCAGFAGELAALAGWHSSPQQVAQVALSAKGLVFAALVVAWASRQRKIA